MTSIATDARVGDPATAFTGTVAEDLAVLVAPSRGRFRPRVSGGKIEAGTIIGHVTGNGSRADPVRSPSARSSWGLLATADTTVRRGQALVWLRRLDPPGTA